jgi:hypothetical protein
MLHKEYMTSSKNPLGTHRKYKAPRAFMDISKKEDKSANILEQMNNLERLILDSKGKSELTEVLIDKKGILTKPRRSVTFSEETQIEDEADQKRTEEDEYLV